MGEDFRVCQSPALGHGGADALALQPQICALELTFVEVRLQEGQGPHPSPGLRCGVSHTHSSHLKDVAQQAGSAGNYDAGCGVRTSGLKGAVALINFLH